MVDLRAVYEAGGALPTLVGPLRLPRPTSFAYISLHTQKTSNIEIDREFRRRKPL